jgi:hypothetical protein
VDTSTTDEAPASPTATPEPTPTPGITTEQISDICDNSTAITAATAYGGKVHPLVLVTSVAAGWLVDASGDRYSIDKKWGAGEWANDLQLVLCVGEAETQNMGKCSGTYTRVGDGATGKVVRYRFYQKVTVVVAATGKPLQSKTIYGTTPTCAKNVSIPATGSGPWQIFGTEDLNDAINSYAVSVSTQK